MLHLAKNKAWVNRQEISAEKQTKTESKKVILELKSPASQIKNLLDGLNCRLNEYRSKRAKDSKDIDLNWRRGRKEIGKKIALQCHLRPIWSSLKCNWISKRGREKREGGRDVREREREWGGGSWREREKSPPSMVSTKNVSRHFHRSPGGRHYPSLQTTNLCTDLLQINNRMTIS